MEYSRLFQEIQNLEQEYIALWEKVCSIESPSAHKAGVDTVGCCFGDLAARHGWQVERLAQSVAGDAWCITMNPDAPGRPIALSGHMDTVHPVGAFGAPPVHRDNEKIYGPGVLDCKGGIVAAVLTMHALEKLGYADRPIRLLLQSDEEVGSALSKRATINYICEKARDAEAFLNLEGYTKGKACIHRKGIITFTFTVNGVEAHAADCAEKGANAIAEAAYKILEIEKIKDAHGLTCCCSVIDGGSVTNTIPGQCVFKVNVRFATGEQEAWIRQYMQEIADRVYIPGCKTTVNTPRSRVAMERTQRNIDLLALMNRAFRESGLPELAELFRKGGSDAADVTVAGIPCVDSIGVQGDFIHTPQEFAWLSSLTECAKRIGSVILYMSKDGFRFT